MRILISGAGIAGLTTAYWLHEYGHDVTVIDKKNSLQTLQGFLIFFWGAGYDIAEKMGILSELKKRDYAVPELKYINKQGAQSAALDMKNLQTLLNNRLCKFFRGDLYEVLLEKVRERITIHSGIEIKNILKKPQHVSVDFTNNHQDNFDLVIGADGVHSTVRKLVFGEESQFLNYLGYQFGVFIHPSTIQLKKSFYAYNTPQKLVAFFPMSSEKQASFFICQSETVTTQNMNLFLDKFQDLGWIIPSILKSVESSDEFFLDELMQVEIATWYKDRVALIGDASHSLSLTGAQGASMAMLGAYQLATELHRQNNDYEKAFLNYQGRMQPILEKKQKAAKRFLRSFVVPDHRRGIYSRNFLLRFLNIPFVSEMIFKGLLNKTSLEF